MKLIMNYQKKALNYINGSTENNEWDTYLYNSQANLRTVKSMKQNQGLRIDSINEEPMTDMRGR